MGQIKLGDKVKDRVTSFEGTATCRAEFLNGNVRWLVEGDVRDGKVIEYYFDEARLVVTVCA